MTSARLPVSRFRAFKKPAGGARYNENPGSIANVVVRGCTVSFGGSDGLQRQANSRAMFTDLADGTLSSTPW
jgi:hypothetical protein